MGYLTTVTIYHDNLHDIEDNKEEFIDELVKTILNGNGGEIGIGSSCNVAKVQKQRHADDWTIYVHAGNTVVELNPYNDKMISKMKSVPDFYDEMIKYLFIKAKELRQLFNTSKD